MTAVRAYDAEGTLVSLKKTDAGYLSDEGEHPKLAGHIEVVHRRGKFSLKVDGVEFPWFVTDDGITTQVGPKSMSTVTVTILAERVTIDDDWR